MRWISCIALCVGGCAALDVFDGEDDGVVDGTGSVADDDGADAAASTGGDGADTSGDGLDESTGDDGTELGPPAWCEELPECDGLECAETDEAATLLAQFMEAADAQGFGDVFVPYDAFPNGATTVFEYALIRPGAISRQRLSSDSPSADFEAAIAGWALAWYDPQIVLAPEEDVLAAFDACHPMLREDLDCYAMLADFRLHAQYVVEDLEACEVTLTTAIVDPITAILADCKVEVFEAPC